MDSKSTLLGGGDVVTPRTPKLEVEDDSKKILCIFHAENKIGAATFDPPSGSFGLLNEIVDSGPTFPLVNCLISQLNPGVVVLSRKADLKLSNVVVETMTQSNSDTPFTLATSTTTTTTTSNSNVPMNSSGGYTKLVRTTVTTDTSTCSSKIVSHGESYTSSSQESVVGRKPGTAVRKRAVPQAFVQNVGGCNNVVTIPHDNFVLETAKKIVLQIRDRELPAEAKSTARMAAVAGKIDMEETVTVRALAGLLKFLDDQTINALPSCIDDKNKGLKIRSIVIEDMVVLNEHSKKALQIFRTNIKTSIATKSASKSEGCSLFKQLESFSPSSIGRKKLREIMNKPLRDVKLINYRLDCIQFFKDIDQETLIAVIGSESSRISNVDTILTRMRLATPTPNDWSAFKRSIHGSIMVAHHILDNQHLKFPDVFIEKLQTINLEGISNLVVGLSETIDFEGTKVREIFTVREGVDQLLDEARVRADRIEECCSDARTYEVNYWAERGMDSACIGVGFWPGIGFLMELQVTAGDFLRATSIIAQDGSCEMVKHTPAAVFYRTPVTNHLNEQFHDPRTFINDRQVEIQMELQEKVTNLAEDIQSLINFCADVQCCIALGNAARCMNWSRPRFNTEGRIAVKEGRHSVQEQYVMRFVPNEYNNEPKKVKIITGPNTSGKSVYMKQVALIVYMAQIGSFVPAESADIHLVDKILTCIKSEESLMTQVSYFMSDVSQVCSIVQEATKDSLVIIDEFGKGTHPHHGTSLLAALLNHFVKDSKQIPNVLLATHFHSAICFVQPHPAIDYIMFTADNSLGNYTNQYKLIQGKANTSLAFEIAESAGISSSILSRSRQVAEKLMARKPIHPLPFQEEQTKDMKGIWKHFLTINLQSKKDFDGFLARVNEQEDKRRQK